MAAERHTCVRSRAAAMAAAVIAAAAVTTAAAVLLLAAGCGTAAFTPGAGPDVRAVLQDAGLTVVRSGVTANPWPGGTSAAWFVVARADGAEPGALVSVLSFDSAAARDAAVRELAGRQRTGVRTDVVYTAGDAVVIVRRVSDAALLRGLDHALRAAGAR